MFFVTGDPLDVRRLEAAVARPEAGAILTFTGTSRRDRGPDGRPVEALEYEAYADMALAEMARIGQELALRWPEARLAVAHRTGRVAVGEASIAVVVSAPHRDEAFAAGRFAIDELKARLPVWKKELVGASGAWRANPEALAWRGGERDQGE